jgi:hypothetical protein
MRAACSRDSVHESLCCLFKLSHIKTDALKKAVGDLRQPAMGKKKERGKE